MRRLQLSVAGRWFVALTILLGIVAINSGNNVIYLIESLLLSGLILSGILSELAISSVRIRLLRKEAFAGQRSRDLVELQNKSRFFLFCLEVGEWRGKNFIPLAFVPRLPPHGKLLLSVEQLLPSRGKYQWDGLVVATMYPYGFARKLRILPDAGERVVWPSPRQKTIVAENNGDKPGGDASQDPSEGDLRPYQVGDDPRRIVWTISASKGEWWVREQKRGQDSRRELQLDLRELRGEALERRLEFLTHEVEQCSRRGQSFQLQVHERNGSKRTLVHRTAALDTLALVQT